MRELGCATEVGDAHDRELQSLRRVDRHQANGVRLDSLDRRIGLDARGARQVLDAIEKAAQVAALGGLEAPRQTQQLVHVGEPTLAPLQRQHVLAIAGRLDRALDRRGDRAQRRAGSLARHQSARASERLAVALRDALGELALAGRGGLRRLPCAPPTGLRRTRDQRQAVARAAAQR